VQDPPVAGIDVEPGAVALVAQAAHLVAAGLQADVRKSQAWPAAYLWLGWASDR
jgi:hypothetical protein